MRKGTTPTFTFTLPFSTENIAKARVVFESGDGKLLKKTVTAENFNDNVISVTLTQEDTFIFDCNSYIKVQLRVLTQKGEALSSDPQRVFVCECLDDEVLQ